MLKTVRNVVFLLFGSIIIGYLLMVAAYAIPLNWSGTRYDDTVILLKDEGIYPREIYSFRTLDNFADSITLLMASYKGNEGPWRQAAANYYISYSGPDFYKFKTTPYDWLTGNHDQMTSEPYRVDYGRYWHGNILFIRVLLLFFSYPQIRMINSIVLLFLIILMLMLLFKQFPRFVLPFSLMLLFLAPTAVSKCIEFSGDIYMMLLASLILVYCGERQLSGFRIRYLFLMVGILTPYVGFFTSPTLSLTVPTVLLCLQRKRERRLFRLVMECILFWGIGYVGMWVGKWVIAALFEGRQFLDFLAGAVQLRSSMKGASRFSGLVRCLKCLFDNKFLDVSLFYLILFTIADNMKHRQRITFDMVGNSLLYLIPVFIVCVWYIVFSNHVFIHYWFTYRHACVIVLAIFALLDQLYEPI